MMKLTMLGTGHATVTKCYNTCFALWEQGHYFLVDAGGGNEILKILEKEKIPLSGICDIFVSHAHTDHIMGVVWVIRLIGQLINGNRYQGRLNVYCHRELEEDILTICRITLPGKITELFGGAVRFVTVEDGQVRTIMGHEARFFDICSTKKKQFGFVMNLENDRRLAFCGDEPLNGKTAGCLAGCDWMMHEAFCLYGERDIFHPYEKHHSTVKDACEAAERLRVKNLILYHTEDTHIEERKRLYSEEGKTYFSGNLLIPDDRETIVL